MPAQQWLLESIGVDPDEAVALRPVVRSQAHRWETNLAAARQYHTREGHLQVPRKHVEFVSDDEGMGGEGGQTAVKLGAWLDNTRRRAATFPFPRGLLRPGEAHFAVVGSGPSVVLRFPVEPLVVHVLRVTVGKNGPMVRRPSPSLNDLTYPDLEDVWQALRETRSDPPGWAGSGNAARRKTYNAALEQAEQLFKAAAEVGPASRPLLLFYALSQAGRAIAAAGQQPDYQLNGHGIGIKHADQPRLGRVLVADKGSGAFTQVASLLGSRSLPQEIALADLWSVIEENDGWPLASAPSSIRCLRVTRKPVGPDSFSRVALDVDGLSDEVAAHRDDRDQLAVAIHQQLSAFPTVDGYEFLHGSVGFSGRDEKRGTVTVSLAWPLGRLEQPSDSDVETVMNKLTPWAGRVPMQRRVHSVLGGDGDQLHPFLAWWAVLYSLSMLARYQPGQWTTQIDVNHSIDAAAVERLLSRALIAVPELALATIDEVAQ